jgi:nitrite reductase/ring-hydroxylating ferredoxin subunit
MKSLLLSVSLFTTAVQGFVANAHPSAKAFALQATTIDCPAVAEGEREIIDGPDGPILVTRVAGGYYAVDATCPHLGLPMKKGKIEDNGGKTTITCNFHNSCFDMKTGKCEKWVTGALGVKSGFISGIMSKVGSGQKDIMAYCVTEKDDGSLIVSSEAPN